MKQIKNENKCFKPQAVFLNPDSWGPLSSRVQSQTWSQSPACHFLASPKDLWTGLFQAEAKLYRTVELEGPDMKNPDIKERTHTRFISNIQARICASRVNWVVCSSYCTQHVKLKIKRRYNFKWSVHLLQQKYTQYTVIKLVRVKRYILCITTHFKCHSLLYFLPAPFSLNNGIRATSSVQSWRML